MLFVVTLVLAAITAVFVLLAGLSCRSSRPASRERSAT
jgi:hypothetical protein